MKLIIWILTDWRIPADHRGGMTTPPGLGWTAAEANAEVRGLVEEGSPHLRADRADE